MREVLDTVREIVATDPERPAIAWANGSPTPSSPTHGSLTYGALEAAVGRAQRALRDCPPTVGLLMPRGGAAIVADLALAGLGRTIVPLPEFFSAEQLRHIVADSGLQAVVAGPATADRAATLAVPAIVLPDDIVQPGPPTGRPVAAGTWRRVIYTSGTTGRPKGVVLDEPAMAATLGGLRRAVDASAADLHLSVLPFALLLEQLAGILLPLSVGARIHVADGPAELFRAAHAIRPTTTILVPELLAAWVQVLRDNRLRAPDSLRFAAVGGAPVAAPLADAAWELGVPVHEGYGLSECCSVVTVNRPGRRRGGTVGQPLDHLAVRIDQGEIVVEGPSVMHGHLGGDPAGGTWRTGDLGHWDGNGNLVVLGRKDDVIVTPAGRNVHPEWIEPMLLADGRIRRAAVVGGPAGVHAALVVESGSAEHWRQRIRDLTASAPDYARPTDVTPLSPGEAERLALFTADGRPRRRRIAQHLFEAPMSFYETLVDATTPDRKAFMAIPLIRRAVSDGVGSPLYLAFLASAYNHVRHTVPLLEAALAKCGPSDAALAAGLREYIAEEAGHDEWILEDIAALGGDAEAVRNARPPLPVRAMVAYAYRLIEEDGPYALLGMVHVLEGMSVALADKAAAAIRDSLGRSGGAGFSYLTSHGSLDIEHVKGYADLLAAVDTPERRVTVIAAAGDFYRLYGDVFRALDAGDPDTGGREIGHAA